MWSASGARRAAWRSIAAACVVAGEVLGGGSGQGAVELVAVGEGLPIGVDMDALAVAGEGHVGGVAVHHWVGEDVGAVDRRALALVDGDRVAVGDAVVLARIKGDYAVLDTGS
jgi:hypothetical protein